MNRCRPLQPRCRSTVKGKRPGFKALIADFHKVHAPNVRREYRCFRRMPSLELAIHHVAFAIDEDEICFDHQYRIIRSARRQAEAVLSASRSSLVACKSFDELHSLLSEVLSPIPGIGELYIYDAAVRMGAYLKVKPKLIYLHAGTRAGAKALGLHVRCGYLQKRDLPVALRVLAADQLESFLCIYRNQF